MQKNAFIIRTLTVVLFLALTACQSTGPVRDVSSINEIQQTVDKSLTTNAAQESKGGVDKPGFPPVEVSQALLPPLQYGGARTEIMEEQFDISVDNAPAKEFFMSLVKDTAYNMVVHPALSGEISLNLRGVTLDEVMSVVRSVYGYAYRKKGNMYEVLPSGLRTEVFKIDYLNVQRAGISETQVSAGRVTDAGSSGSSSSNDSNNSSNENDGSGGTSEGGTAGTMIRTEGRSDFWQELQSTLEILVSNEEGQRIVITPQAGIVVVRAMPDEIESVREYMQKAEMILRRQVIIEAKIMEVELKDGFQAGINWTALGNPSSGKSVLLSTTNTPLSNVDEIGGIFSLDASLNDFTAIVELLETQGVVQVLSSPRISTVNNQKAVIKVGTDEFFVTEVTNTTTSSSVGTVSTPSVELTPFFSGISLDVTPQISEDDEVILHIHPSVSEVKDQQKEVKLFGSTMQLPLALSTIREADSIVFARNGQVIVIGGLMQNISRDVDAGTPFLSKVPVLGGLFKQKRQESVKSELVILLKPVVMKAGNWNQQIEQSADSFRNLRGQLPERDDRRF